MNPFLPLFLLAFAPLSGFTATPTAATPLESILEAEESRTLTPALTQALAHKDAKVRARAARALGRINHPSVISPVIQLLTSEKKSDVLGEVLFALGQLGWVQSTTEGHEVELFQAISPFTKDASAKIRSAATEALGKIPDPKVPDLLNQQLADKDSGVRAEAVIGLARNRMILKFKTPDLKFGDLNPENVKTLELLATDPSAQVRRALGFMIARNREKSLYSAALKLSKDSDATARYYGTLALERIGTVDHKDEALARFIELSQDRSYSVRIVAIRATGTLKSAQKIKPSLEQDSMAQVRAAYAEALGESPTSDEMILGRLAQDKSPLVRASALIGLAHFKGKDAGYLLESAKKDSTWIIREAAVQASDQLEPAARLAYLLAAAKDKDPRVAGAAIEAAGSIPGPQTYALIASSLTSTQLALRGSAVGTLESRTEPDRTALAWKCFENSKGPLWTEARETLVDLFIKIDSSETTGYLKSAALDPSFGVAIKANRALKVRGVTPLPPLPNDSGLALSPYAKLRFKKNPRIQLELKRGKIVLELDATEAPVHTANMVGFTRTGGYDGTPFHRLVPNFVIQGGDPDKSGWGGAGYSVRAEINRLRFERGTLGMPRSQGFDTGGVQIFITHLFTPHLDGQYTVFGRIVQGMDVLDRIEKGDLILKAKVL